MSPAVPLLPSYASGTSDVPLLGETIGDNFDRTVAADPRPRGAGRRADRAALDLRAAARRRRRAGPGPARGSASRRATGSASGRRTGRSGRWCSTPRPRSARSWSTSTRPTARTSWSTCSSRPGIALLVAAPSVQDLRLRGDDRRGARRTARRCAQVVLIGTPSGTRCWRPGDGGDPADLAAPAGRALARRRRSTSSTPRAPPASPRAPRCRHHNILNNGYFVGRAAAATPRTTGSASRCRSTTASAW